MPYIKCLLIGTASTEVRLCNTSFLIFPLSYYTLTNVQLLPKNYPIKMKRHGYIFKSSPSKTESYSNPMESKKQLKPYMTPRLKHMTDPWSGKRARLR